MVLAGFVTAWRLASWPTRRSPVFVKATTDGTVRPPSAEAMTVGSPPSMTATTLFVVPRSMPMILPMWFVSPWSGRLVGWWMSSVVGRRIGAGSVGPGGRLGRRVRIGRRGDGHEGRPEDAIAELVAAPDDLDDLALVPAGAGHVDDRLVLARVERLACLG